jgi:hypothetical protein
VVEVDPVFGDAELAQPVTLRGEVLGAGGAAGVARWVGYLRSAAKAGDVTAYRHY